MNDIKMKSYIIIFMLPLIVLAVSCTKTGKKRGYSNDDPVAVSSFTVKQENVVYYDTYPGTVEALNEVQLRSEVNGYVTAMSFREGSHVVKGQKLYEIDRSKYEAAYEAAKASLGVARSNLEKAQRDADRYQNLDQQNAIAKQTLEDALTALENAKMQVKLSEANLKTAETDYNYSLINAPFSGLIGFSNVKPGAFVTAGQTLLTSISSDNPIGVDFEIDQKSLPYFLKLMQSGSVSTDSAFKVILPDNSEYDHFGKLDVIDRAVDPQTGTVRIRVVFPNHAESLRPGMSCRMEVLD